jgi:hypothetical protein
LVGGDRARATVRHERGADAPTSSERARAASHGTPDATLVHGGLTMIGPEPNGIVAVFPSRFEADAAVEWLQFDGVEKGSLSIVGGGEALDEPPPELDHGRGHRAEVAAYWASGGAVLGALIGIGPAAIALAASTVGLGPLLTALAIGTTVAVATAALGAIGSAMFGVGAHERRARLYERALAAGKYLVVVHTDDPAALRDAKDELTTLGAESVDVHGLSRATS